MGMVGRIAIVAGISDEACGTRVTILFRKTGVARFRMGWLTRIERGSTIKGAVPNPAPDQIV